MPDIFWPQGMCVVFGDEDNSFSIKYVYVQIIVHPRTAILAYLKKIMMKKFFFFEIMSHGDNQGYFRWWFGIKKRFKILRCCNKKNLFKNLISRRNGKDYYCSMLPSAPSTTTTCKHKILILF